jgi:hypothetical protein
MVKSADTKKRERALITLASISFDSTEPHLLHFYDSTLVNQLITMSTQIDQTSAVYALDALRNLTNQAFLIDRFDIVDSAILKSNYLASVLQIISQATEILLQGEVKEPKKLEHLRNLIEQTFCNLEELAQFLDSDDHYLKELTCSPLTEKAFAMISEQSLQAAIGSVSVMVRISKFFKELTEDNSHAKALLTA